MVDEERPGRRVADRLPFAEARALIRTLGIASQLDYDAKHKSGALPAGVPLSPHKVYEEFQGWGDWLGTGRARRNRRTVRGETKSFSEARAFARTLGLKAQKEYAAWARSDRRPAGIPANPAAFYKDEWTNYGDWLGIQQVAYRPFEEARQYARALGFTRRKDWQAHTRTPGFPNDVPLNPDGSYSQWMGWSDWLGNTSAWNRLSIQAFLASLRPFLAELKPAEIFAILDRKQLLNVNSRRSYAHTIQAIEKLCRPAGADAAIEELINQLGGEANRPGDPPAEANLEVDATAATLTQLAGGTELPVIQTLAELSTPDRIVSAQVIDDEDLLEFLVNNRVAELWQAVLAGTSPIQVEELRRPVVERYSAEIRRRFLSQYDGANNLAIPPRYGYTKENRPCPPTLMQKLTAYRVLHDRRVGNWSGVGAGKTVSAILSALVVNARVTVIVAFNSTLPRWEEEIRNACPTAAITVKERGPFTIDETRPNFIVLNYESFQQTWGETELVPHLARLGNIDFVVLDEIQSVRQRSEADESRRRSTVRKLLDTASQQNPNLHVLGMSATPVINNLHECKVTLEMVTGENLGEMPLRSTIANAARFHQLMIRHGLRFRPNYSQQVTVRQVVIDGRDLVAQLQQLPRVGFIPGLERILLKAKLPTIAASIQPGTLIYTQFITDMVEPLEEAVRERGLTAGLFTGDDKEGLQAFLNCRKADTQPRVDVLIGSAPIGTGIDGLQTVCNRLVFACLPWTSAEFNQIIGRLTRLGGVFDQVEVLIPVVVLPGEQGREWSWDRYRLQCIEFKRTIADAVIDGVIPEGRLPSRDEMYQESVTALQDWIRDVERQATPPQRAAETGPLVVDGQA